MVAGNELAPFFRIEPCCDFGGADQITEQYRQMPPFIGSE
jgi:hypothetical protein